MKQILFIFFVLLSFNINADNNQIKLSKLQRYNLGIKVGALIKVKSIPLLTAPAKVAIPPDQEYIVSSSQAGLIQQLNKTEGDHVKKGQLLAQINSPELLALQREYLHAISKKQVAWVSFQRDKKLLNGGIIPNKRLQETQARYGGEKIEVNAIQQLLMIAGMPEHDIKQLSKTQRLSSKLNIYAPATGVILEKMAVVGQRLDMLAPIYRIANLNQLWLEINIPQEQADIVKVGDRIIINKSPIRAKITLLTHRVNVNNQSVLARAIIETKNSSLRVGQNVNVHIQHNSKQVAFEVPNVAIAQHKGKAYIFVQIDSGFLVRPVTVIGQKKKVSIITSELTGTEKIALRGAVALKANWVGLGSEE
ncbi:MAG: efflux RND transporter periplasmic adaptor subunit [Methylococcales bacterium]|nr:efflux RND transporter periplasmic adaptor subunit [Methylococcales bacterium]